MIHDGTPEHVLLLIPCTLFAADRCPTLKEDEEKQAKENAKARRIFHSIDIDGGGSLDVMELHRALANFAPSTSFTCLRRHLLLQYG